MQTLTVFFGTLLVNKSSRVFIAEKQPVNWKWKNRRVVIWAVCKMSIVISVPGQHSGIVTALARR